MVVYINISDQVVYQAMYIGPTILHIKLDCVSGWVAYQGGLPIKSACVAIGLCCISDI